MATTSHAPNFNNKTNNYTHQHYTNNNINNNNNNNTNIINTIITLFNISTKNLNTLLSTTLKQLQNNPQYSHPATNPTPPSTQASLGALPPPPKGITWRTIHHRTSRKLIPNYKRHPSHPSHLRPLPQILHPHHHRPCANSCERDPLPLPSPPH